MAELPHGDQKMNLFLKSGFSPVSILGRFLLYFLQELFDRPENLLRSVEIVSGLQRVQFPFIRSSFDQSLPENTAEQAVFRYSDV